MDSIGSAALISWGVIGPVRGAGAGDALDFEGAIGLS